MKKFIFAVFAAVVILAFPALAHFSQNCGNFTDTCTVQSSGRLVTVSLTPAATPAAIGTTEQTFTVNGLLTADSVTLHNATAHTSLCPAVSARVSAANTVAISFVTLTALACTPGAGTYVLHVFR